MAKPDTSPTPLLMVIADPSLVHSREQRQVSLTPLTCGNGRSLSDRPGTHVLVAARRADIVPTTQPDGSIHLIGMDTANDSCPTLLGILESDSGLLAVVPNSDIRDFDWASLAAAYMTSGDGVANLQIPPLIAHFQLPTTDRSAAAVWAHVDCLLPDGTPLVSSLVIRPH